MAKQVYSEKPPLFPLFVGAEPGGCGLAATGCHTRRGLQLIRKLPDDDALHRRSLRNRVCLRTVRRHSERNASVPCDSQYLPALVLNADFRPLSYYPLSLWSWQDSIRAVWLDRVSVLSEYDTVVRSPTQSLRLPSVIALKDYIPAARKPAFTRFNVFLRDNFSCQYCNTRFPTQELTFDHVIPRSKGGAPVGKTS